MYSDPAITFENQLQNIKRFYGQNKNAEAWACSSVANSIVPHCLLVLIFKLINACNVL